MTSPARRRLLGAGGSLLAATLLATTVTTLPARAVTGRVVVSDNDRAQPVYDVSSSDAGTVFVTTGGAVRLVKAPMTPASEEIALGSRGASGAPYPAQEVSIVGDRVAIPLVDSDSAFATSVKSCLVADCPVTQTLAVPAGYRYVGNARDVAVLHKPSTNTLALSPWTGGPLTTVSLGTRPAPLGAYADATGIALWHPAAAAYVARPSLAVTTLPGEKAYLTDNYVVFTDYGYPSFTVERVPRATPGAPPEVLAAVPSPRPEPRRLVATDDAAAWSAEPGVSLWGRVPPQVDVLWTLAFGGDPVEAGLVEWDALAPFEGSGSFLAHRDDDTHGRGFHAVAPATGSAVPVHELPAVPATVGSIGIANGRVVYADDSRPGGAAYVRDVSGAQPGAETLARTPATDVAISGPFVAVSRRSADPGDRTVGVEAGQLGRLRPWGTEPGTLDVSGKRLLVRHVGGISVHTLRHGEREPAPRAGVDAVTGAVAGDLLYTADATGTIRRHHLLTGAVTTVRAGTCGGACGGDRTAWRLSAWGDDLGYALDLGAHGKVAAHWDGATGTTTPLPALAAGWTGITYREGLLLAHRPGDGVRLYDLGTGADVLVDATGSLPSGHGLDDSYVAWRDGDGRAVVQPIADFFPGHDAAPVYLNQALVTGFGPGLPSGQWRPEWYVSEDGAAWRVVVRHEDATTPTRTFEGTVEDGLVTLVWPGDDGTGGDAPQGWYEWTLTSAAGTRTGRVFLSRDPLPRPVLHAPALASDAGADGRFTISWTDVAPGYAHYEVWRSRNGGDMFRVASTEKTSLVIDSNLVPYTYRFEVYVVDPAFRTGEAAAATTVVPHDDATGKPSSGWVRRSDARHWHGSHLRSGTAGATLSWSGLTADGLYLVGARGPSYGRYRVIVDGTRVYTYDAYSPTVRFRQVLFRLGGLDPAKRHSVVVQVVGTAGRPNVSVDGLGVRAPVRTDWGH